ncbi:MAG TPA: MarR family transcriptional regulator [Actinophytocola sp.]|uniref:MarR family winged helix-turn-helix transcriptional regulator n=1 Tax=Actinophytocola sp. TaxID=1872138 RepID=UPI002DDD5A15|nr:MarR family transcriptional regulator [Actinophytocola sp.]HEV2782800.1 MarR family transcriptional regulator [Actinophytocola sp.]
MNKPSDPASFEAETAGRLGDLIKRAEQAVTLEKTKALRDLELTVPQYTVLLALSYTGGASGAQLARICLVTPQTMTTVLSNLEAKELVARETSSLHQKVLVTTLTRTGRAVLKKADAKIRAVEDRLTSAFDARDRATLMRLLTQATHMLNGAG